MAEFEYLKIPKDRIGSLIGSKGEIKKTIEKLTKTSIDIDSEDGVVTISPTKEMKDPLSIWKANNIIKAIGRGFSPENAIKLENDDYYLEIIKIPLYVGKSKKALARYKGRVIGKDGKTREIIIDMAEVSMAVYGKTVSLIGELENIMVAKEAVEMILNGSRHKSVYGFLESKKQDRKMKEFKTMLGLENENEIELRDDI
ncbi:MAG: KH domain-containing protein [Methanobrevibacter sp.]|nr:KH domain-containing protein [Candidatus Methanoflexus mossambicus]